MNEKKFKLEINNKTLEVTFKNLAEQANSNAIIQYGETLVLSTCVMGKEREDLGFFPLTVDYEEKYYAAGKIKGARYIRREGRPSDEAVCNARLIDRVVRPLFPENLSSEIQVIATVFSWDSENDPDILGLIGSSIVLSTSNIPWNGPIGAVRVVKKEDNFIINPTYKEREDAEVDVIFAGMIDKKELLINMIEGNFKEADEKVILEALDFAENYIREIIKFQEEIIKEVGQKKEEIKIALKEEELEKEIKTFLNKKIEESLFEKSKIKRTKDLNDLKNSLSLFIKEKYKDEKKIKYAEKFFEEEINRLIHESAIKNKKRVDGRKMNEVREISCEVGLLPRAHGSGLFSRGITRGLSILTLGAPGDQQIIEGMEIVGKKRFMHHYNFPPYSVGEARPLRGPGRREIGHGTLAEKAISPLLPAFEEFPYTIRIVSEMLSSNGSTSMASVSSSSLALMDAGVPIKRPAAGIAIGLMKNEETGEYEILTDIQGPEDHNGDMDFKVAGTEEGVTAIQMDVKIKGISKEIAKEALSVAKKARVEIIEKMKKVIKEPRKDLSPYAPRIITIKINPEKIREVIGPGGKVINEIVEKTGATIDIEQTGEVFITADDLEAAEKAVAWVKEIVREIEVGEIFEGKVERILDFGAFVNLIPNQDGLIHISKLAPYRVNKVEDVVNVGDVVVVKVISIDEQGRVNLTLIENKKEKKG